MDELIQKEFQKVNDKIDKIDRRLFEDNGSECLQSRINRLSTWTENHEKQGCNKVAFYYWLIPLCLTIVIFALDVYLRYKAG